MAVRVSATESGRNSQTATITRHETTNSATTNVAPILRLRGAYRNDQGGARVQWADDVVDNEGLGRKSSKVCCIYHRPRGIDESSSDSSSSSSDESSSDESKKAEESGKPTPQNAHHSNDSHSCGRPERYSRKRRGKRAPSPNAYEKIPRRTVQSGKSTQSQKSS